MSNDNNKTSAVWSGLSFSHEEIYKSSPATLHTIEIGLQARQKLLKEHLEFVQKSPSHYPSGETEKIHEELNKTQKELDDISKLRHVEREIGGNRLQKKPLYYSDYLRLDWVLNAQPLESEKTGKPAHHEMFFIIVHQAFELWFKQVLHEMNLIVTVMNREYVPEKELSVVHHSLVRIIEIQKLMIQQFTVLETMTPLDFMDFRDLLFPASGFQSYQFRLFENLLGLKAERRILHNRQPYFAQLCPVHQTVVQESEKHISLFDVVEKWLERTPFLQNEKIDFNFLNHYKNAGNKMFEEDKKVIMKVTEHLDNEAPEKIRELQRLQENQASFNALFDEKLYKEQLESGSKRLSFKALQAALLIFIYQDEPLFQLPFMILQALIDIDENLASWRYRHALMTARMIGSKIGTGGSSGYYYLKSTVERGRVFSDIANLATYLLPRHEVPPLPEEVRTHLGYVVEQTKH